MLLSVKKHVPRVFALQILSTNSIQYEQLALIAIPMLQNCFILLSFAQRPKPPMKSYNLLMIL